ncbi:hypothetical protein NEOKW01_0052 [Nematocida sp. AWRm80]|nr:hypothetical protein NEOKW01_0052 [Nematocida sp. AWRm80]
MTLSKLATTIETHDVDKQTESMINGAKIEEILLKNQNSLLTDNQSNINSFRDNIIIALVKESPDIFLNPNEVEEHAAIADRFLYNWAGIVEHTLNYNTINTQLQTSHNIISEAMKLEDPAKTEQITAQYKAISNAIV